MLRSKFFPLTSKFSRSQVRDLYRFASRRLKEEHLSEVAGSLTFTTIFALVPFLAIAFAIFTAFPVFDTFRAALEGYFIQNLMPRAIANTILEYLSEFAAKSRGVSAIGSVILIVTAIVTLSMIDQAFNQIWRVKTARPLKQRILVYWAIVTLGPLLLGISISVTSYLLAVTNRAAFDLPVLGAIAYTMVSVFLATGAFTLLYIVVPNRLVDWRDALWGGLLAGVAFEVAKRLFAFYLLKFPTYTVIYGAVATVPIFLLWIYLFWMITLTGALIAAALPVVKYERWWHVSTPGSAFVDAMGVLRVLHDARASGANAAVNARDIRAQNRLGIDECENLLERMLEAGWVARIKVDFPRRVQWGKHINEGFDRWTLLANPEQVKLADVYRLFVFNTSNNPLLASKVEAVVEQGLQQNLAEYFMQEQQASV